MLGFCPKGLLCRGLQNLCSSGVCLSVSVRVCPCLLQPFLDPEFGSFTTGIGRFEGPKSGQNCANRPKWTMDLVRSRLVLDGSRSKNGLETHTIDTSGPPYPVGVIYNMVIGRRRLPASRSLPVLRKILLFQVEGLHITRKRPESVPNRSVVQFYIILQPGLSPNSI